MSESPSAKGVIIDIKPVWINTDGTYHNIQFTIEEDEPYNPAYPEFITFELSGKVGGEKDKVSSFMQYKKIGDKVDVNFNVGGNRWTDPKTNEVKYFNKLKAWSVFSQKEEELSSGDVANEELAGEEEIPF